MKKTLIGACLLIACFMIAPKTEAQIRVKININIGDQPSWRVQGYDYVEYYYLPDIECYYYVPRHQFVYLSNGNWVFSTSLPLYYRDYNLHTGYKVVINRPNAYHYHDNYKRQFPKKHAFVNKGGRHNNNGKHKGWHKKGHH